MKKIIVSLILAGAGQAFAQTPEGGVQALNTVFHNTESKAAVRETPLNFGRPQGAPINWGQDRSIPPGSVKLYVKVPLADAEKTAWAKRQDCITVAQGAGLAGGIAGVLVGGTLGYIAAKGTAWAFAAAVGGAIGGGLLGIFGVAALAYLIACIVSGTPLFN